MLISAHLPCFLKSETFWVFCQFIVALVGLIVVIMYTRYTKRMMELQLETRRAEIAPVFILRWIRASASQPMTPEVAESTSSPKRNLHLQVTNIGKGPALRFRGWHGPVDPTFCLEESYMLTRKPDYEDGASGSLNVLANETAEMAFQRTDKNKYWLCVLECEDTSGHKHQFQLIYIPRPAANDIWLMVHGW